MSWIFWALLAFLALAGLGYYAEKQDQKEKSKPQTPTLQPKRHPATAPDTTIPKRIRTCMIRDLLDSPPFIMTYRHKNGELKQHQISEVITIEDNAFRAKSETNEGKICFFYNDGVVSGHTDTIEYTGLSYNLKVGQKYRITYIDNMGEYTERTIRVKELTARHVIAHCYLRKQERSFAYSNIIDFIKA